MAPSAAHPHAPAKSAAAASGRELSLEDFARIVVAVERGELARIQERLKMDRQEIERARAVWAERLRTEPKLAATLEEAVESARWE